MQTSLTDKVVNRLGIYWSSTSKIILPVCAIMGFHSCLADIAVIVHPDNTSEFNQGTIRQMFLGKKQTFSNGAKVTVYELATPSKQNQRLFYGKLLEKDQNTLQAYWARMLFSSKATPPIKLTSNTTMKYTVANTLLALGYIDTRYLDDSVKTVLIIKD